MIASGPAVFLRPPSLPAEQPRGRFCRHSRASGNPYGGARVSSAWIPACAGMTAVRRWVSARWA
ncbi:hypothetical protein GTP81_28920 [Rugamonas sp. FT107W]|uniref:Uncharacterized protein n=1 Tax=Duganella vulcania TaxID=2692166 RepID=A0A845HQ39_9BURK|nr:hypothetical protein [Duganella vulcania]